MSNVVPISLELELSAVRKGIDEINAQLKNVGKEAGLWSGVGVGLEHAFEKSLEVVKSAISTAAEFLTDSFNEAVKAVRVDTVLEVSIRNAGEAATFTAKEIENLAKMWQDRTIFDDEAIKKAATGLINLGIAGDNLLDAVKTSQDLATVMGDLGSASDTLGKALANPERAVQLLRRAHLLGAESAKHLGDALANAGSEAEKQRAVLDTLNATYAGQAEALAKNAGAVEQLKNQWADVKEEVGKQILPIVNELLPGMKHELKLIGEAIVELVKAGASWFMSWGEGMGGASTASEKFVAGIAIMEAHIQRFALRTKQAMLELKSIWEAPTSFSLSKNDRELAKVEAKIDAVPTDEEAAASGVQNFRKGQNQPGNDSSMRGRKPPATGTDESSFHFDPKLSEKARNNMEKSAQKEEAEREKEQKEAHRIHERLQAAMEKGRKEAIADGEKAKRLDEQFADMQERLMEVTKRGNQDALSQRLNSLRVTSAIEDGGSVFNRIQTAAASANPAKDTAANTKSIDGTLKKIFADMQQNRGQRLKVGAVFQ